MARYVVALTQKIEIGSWVPHPQLLEGAGLDQSPSHTTTTPTSRPDLSLDIKPHLSDKRCSCDGEQFTPSRLKRGDLGQLAPRKKLLKSFRAFLEDFLRSLQAFGTEGFSFLAPSLLTLNPFSEVWQLCSRSLAGRGHANLGDRGYG
jgi:hypothetical protein